VVVDSRELYSKGLFRPFDHYHPDTLFTLRAKHVRSQARRLRMHFHSDRFKRRFAHLSYAQTP